MRCLCGRRDHCSHSYRLDRIQSVGGRPHCGADGIASGYDSGGTSRNAESEHCVLRSEHHQAGTGISGRTARYRGTGRPAGDAGSSLMVPASPAGRPDTEVLAGFDSDSQFPLRKGDYIEIRKAEQTTKILKLSRIGFLETLRHKMSAE